MDSLMTLLDLYKGDMLSVSVTFPGHTNIFICHTPQYGDYLIYPRYWTTSTFLQIFHKLLKTCPFHNWMSCNIGKNVRHDQTPPIQVV